MPLRTPAILLAAILCLALAGCGGDRHDAPPPPPTATAAIAVITPITGYTASGTVRFVQEHGQVRVVADLTGLSPGKHGFHIHEFGDATAPDLASTGGHFDAGGHPHGGPESASRHTGDLGNLVADASGHAHLEAVLPGATLTGATGAIVGRALIVHEREDDLTSQPSGNSGGRIAYGIIGIAKPKP